MEAERFVAQPALDDFLKSHKRASANEKNIGGVDRKEFLMWMFAPALRRDIGNRTFQNLQQRLLHAFAGHIAGDRRVFVLAANLVDLVNVNNPLLGALDVAIRG